MDEILKEILLEMKEINTKLQNVEILKDNIENLENKISEELQFLESKISSTDRNNEEHLSYLNESINTLERLITINNTSNEVIHSITDKISNDIEYFIFEDRNSKQDLFHLKKNYYELKARSK